MSMLDRLRRRARYVQLRLAGAEVDRTLQAGHLLIDGDATGFYCGSHALFEEGSKIVIGSFDGRRGQVCIGQRFYCNRFTMIDAAHSIEIGDRVQIGPFGYITDFDHDLRSKLDRSFHRPVAVCAPVSIEDEVWIGAHVTILKGVKVGSRSVVGAGSVVTRDIPADCIAFGSPAQPVKYLNPRA